MIFVARDWLGGLQFWGRVYTDWGRLCTGLQARRARACGSAPWKHELSEKGQELPLRVYRG